MAVDVTQYRAGVAINTWSNGSGDIGRGSNLIAATAACINLDSLLMNQVANYDLGTTSNLDMSIGGTGTIGLNGQGKDQSIILTQHSGGPWIKTGILNCLLQDFTIWGNANQGGYPIATGTSTVCRNVLLNRVKVRGNFDGIGLNGTASSMGCKDCEIISGFDCLRLTSGANADTGLIWLDNTILSTIGTGGSGSRGIAVTRGTVIARNCRISADMQIPLDSIGPIAAVFTDGPGAVYLQNSVLSSSNVGGLFTSVYDIQQTLGGKVYVDPYTVYQTSTGTVTPLTSPLQINQPSLGLAV